MSRSNGDTWERLGALVRDLMERKQVPGVAVGVLHRGEVSVAGFGVTSIEQPLPVTDDTLFQIGSITKTFTGTAVMRLVEAGKIELDATVCTYLPGFCVADKEASARATVRHLLTHTGGWAGDFFHATGAGDDALARYVADMAELPQLAPLNTIWSYNNAGFSVAGRIIEVVTGKSYELALRELVLEPLGLERTFFDAGEVLTHRFAVGHNEGEAGPEVARPWTLERSAYPAGGIACHVGELLRYARFHLGDGEGEEGTRLLSADSLAAMQNPQVTVWDKASWGLTWGLEEIAAPSAGDSEEGSGSVRQVQHGGGTNGQVSLLALVPGCDFAISILTNADRGGQITREVRRWAFQEYLGLEVPEPGAIESAREELVQYVGRYEGYFDDLELGLLAGKLVGQMTYKRSFPNEETPPSPTPPPASVARCEEDRLLVTDGPAKDTLGDVIRKPDGSIGWLRFGGRLHARKAPKEEGG
jgi:CubicO group peptidase (beta-lactamase class C family)